MGFKDDLAAAKEHVSDRVKTPRIPVVVNGTLHEVVFYRASTEDWARETVTYLARPGVTLDLKNGYNLTGVTRAIAPKYGRLVVDGEETPLTVTPATDTAPAVDEWADLWEVMAPATARIIEVNVWHLHEHDAEQEIERAKKASKPRPASRKKSS